MRSRLAAGVAGALVAIAYLIRLPLIGVRNYDPDELQHLHGAYAIAHGLLPYRDYFDHHMPLLHLLLAPLLLVLDVERSSSRAFASLSLVRGLMWLATGAILLLSFRLARELRGTRAAWLSVAFLSTCWLFFDKTLEIRPDVPACALLVLALRLAARGVSQRIGIAFAQCGLACGLGLLLTQKLAFALIGMLAGLWLAGAPLIAFLAWGAGCAAPLLSMLGYFLLRGGLRAFLECNVLVNLRWQAHFGPGAILRDELFAPNAALCAFALVGLLRLLAEPNRHAGAQRSARAVVLSGLGAFAGLWLVRVPWQQYYLTFLPVLALLAGLGLVWASERVADAVAPPARRSAVAQALSASLLLLSSLPPLALFREQFGRSNADKLASLRFVIENSAPAESVLDGYTGVGVYRPHAWRFYFLHAELRQMLGDAERRELLQGLRSGAISPRLISYDGHSTRVSPEVTAFFEQHYESVGQGPLWARVFPLSAAVWDDAAARPLRRPDAPATGAYVLVGAGWGETEHDAGVAFRRSRGRQSQLLLPLREPRGGRVVLRARAGSDVAGLGFEVSLNGTSLGSATPSRTWGEHVFAVAPALLRRGFNRLLLRYARTPNQAQPSHAGPNAVIALESVRLESTP